MPEGDTLEIIARTLAPALVGRIVTRAESHIPGVPEGALVGRVIAAVEARGKHLLIRFDDGRVLHTHLRMHGSWHLYHPGERWRAPRNRLRVALHAADAVAVCFGAPTVRLLPKGAEARDPILTSLGPDLLAEAFDAALARERLRARADVPLGEAVLDQGALAGLGNVYKSEVLFVRRLDPFAEVSRFSDEELDGVLTEGRAALARNVAARRAAATGRDPFRAAPDPFALTRRTTRRRGDGERLWVYERSGLPCFVCGATIAMRRQGALHRSTYFCPRCQPARVDRT